VGELARFSVSETEKSVYLKGVNLKFWLQNISRFLDEPSLATALQGVYFIFYIFAATWFGPCWPSYGEIHNYFRKLLHSQRIRCFVLLNLTYCICLANIVFVFLICVCELSKLGQITSLLIVKTLKYIFCSALCSTQ
jgi:hypothetical protein